jgi:HSP20 family protein
MGDGENERRDAMATLVKRNRPTLAELLWSAWPFENIGLDLATEGHLAMRMEEFVEGDTLVIRAELPGIDPEKDVEITVENGVLTIAAERREEVVEGEAGKSGYRSEFRYGSYRRSMTLPAGATEDDVKATYADGILEVRVPVGVEKPTTRKVEITRA